MYRKSTAKGLQNDNLLRMDILVRVLIIIPARGGSKGIPRKNIRPLAGKPLISHVIETSLASKFKPDVYVSSDDPEILLISERFGALVHRRDVSLANDTTTLDPVIMDAWRAIESSTGNAYDYIVTVQPTAPLLTTKTLDDALVAAMATPDVDCTLSAKKVAHLTWRKTPDGFIPNYKERLNRQQLEPQYFETGAIFINPRRALETYGARVQGIISVFEVPEREAVDIDDFADWSLCEFYLSRKTILFVVTGNREVGLGHVYRTLLLANDIVGHRVHFLLDPKSALGAEKIAQSNFDVQIASSDDLIAEIDAIKPDLVINDILDTSSEYMEAIKAIVPKIVNFEDLGSGALLADKVFNALYPETRARFNHFFGHAYFCARDEFVHITPKPIADVVQRVLLTFGGTDPNDFTRKVLHAILPECSARGIAVTAILGMGYLERDLRSEFEEVEFLRDITDISTYMKTADLVFTSAGRTVYEIACIGTPAVVLCQNHRETTHFFASAENGFVNMGLGTECAAEDIRQTFLDLVGDRSLRGAMSASMLSNDVKSGRTRVVNSILDLLKE